jgi:hypothetical protein
MGERRSVIIIATTVVLIVGLVLVWAFVPSAQDQASTSPLTEVADKAVIQEQIPLTHLSIATSENFAAQKIRVIGGTLTNRANMPIRMIEVKLTFTDYDGKSVQEYSERVLEQNQKPLAPGSEYRFEVRLENLPRTWNYRVPITEVTKIGF